MNVRQIETSYRLRIEMGDSPVHEVADSRSVVTKTLLVLGDDRRVDVIPNTERLGEVEIGLFTNGIVILGTDADDGKIEVLLSARESRVSPDSRPRRPQRVRVGSLSAIRLMVVISDSA